VGVDKNKQIISEVLQNPMGFQGYKRRLDTFITFKFQEVHTSRHDRKGVLTCTFLSETADFNHETLALLGFRRRICQPSRITISTSDPLTTNIVQNDASKCSSVKVLLGSGKESLFWPGALAVDI
jgi:hypothetical protein